MPAIDLLPAHFTDEDFAAIAAYVASCGGTEPIEFEDLRRAGAQVDPSRSSYRHRMAVALAKSRVDRVRWGAADPKRGARLFRKHRCRQCHTRDGKSGPALAGIAGRMSREQIALGIATPPADGIEPYHPTFLREPLADLAAYLSSD